jgi:DNA-binding GntR family transcriptional regulator
LGKRSVTALTHIPEPDAASDLRIDQAPKTLREIALERVRSAIMEFRFPPGARLTERELCHQLGVSRSVVREVLRHLETEGLVQTIPHHGPIVAKLDREAAAQIYEIRGLLESAAAHAAAEHADAPAIAKMGAAMADIESAYAAGNHRAVLAATTRFYETMFLCGGKTVAWEMVQRLNGRISRLRAMTIASPGRHLRGPAQMRKIYDAISRHDPSAAAAACREHVARAAQIAQALLSDQKDN